MKTFDGYKKRNLTDKDYALLAGGGHKALDTLFSALSSDTTNAIKITVGGTLKSITTSTLKTSLGLGSNAYTSIAYLPLAGGTMNGALTMSTGAVIQLWDDSAIASHRLSLRCASDVGRIYNYTGSAYGAMYVGHDGTNAIVITSGLNVGIGTGSPSQKLHINGNAIATNFGVNSTAGSGQGISLYNGSGYVNTYGIAFVTTGNWGTHGYVTSDWATYFTMNNLNNRGWIFKRNGSGNVFSIDTSGLVYANGRINGNYYTSRVATGTQPYACTSTTLNANLNADLLDGYHASGLVKFYLSPMTSNAPADSAKSWFINTMPSSSGAIVYNVPGAEKTIIAGKSSGKHGHMLQLNYDDNYLRILRYYSGAWKTTDWEKISAGYADSAGSATKATLDSDGNTIKSTYLKLSGGTMNSTAQILCCTKSKGSSDVYNGAIQLREATYSTTSCTDNMYDAPGITFHWGGRWVHKLNMHSNSLYWDNTKISLDGHTHSYLPLSGGTCTGNIYAPHFYESSDIRYKKVLKNLSINSNTIANLPLFDFEWIENNSIGTGTSAQAVQEILPNIVSGTDKLTLDYGVLGTIAGITACKELVNLKSEIDLLKDRIKELELKLKMINDYGRC